MIRLGVNVDHVATVRQARRVEVPDPVEAALLAEKAGADGITVHLREDRRHIQERDVELMRRRLSTKLNLEMAVTPAMVALAEKLRPDDACFVPEKREELTTEGGLDVAANKQKILRGRQTPSGSRHPRKPVHRSRKESDRSQPSGWRSCSRDPHRNVLQRGRNAAPKGAGCSGRSGCAGP